MERIGEEKKMSVKEVADAIGYESETIRKKVKELFPEIVENGKPTMLSEKQVSIIRNNLFPRTPALKSGVESAVTSLDIEEMTIRVIQYHMAEAARLRLENQQQREKLALAAPKVEFYDQVADSKDAIDMRSAAAVLNIHNMGRNNLFAKLRQLGIVDDENCPYRKYQDAGLFRVIETRYTDSYGDTHITKKTLVYQKGLDYIRKAVTK